MKIIQIDSGSQCAISCDVSFADSLVAWRKPTPHTNDGVLRVSYQQGQKIENTPLCVSRPNRAKKFLL